MLRKGHQHLPISGYHPSTRQGTDALSPLSQFNAKNIINQRLIEGPQSSPLASAPRRIEHEAYLPTLRSPPADDLQYDAFDLELLAQSEEPVNNQQSTLYSAENHTLFYDRLRANGPAQVSRFFRVDSHATPHRILDSNSSDPGVRSPSSPLARFQPGGTVSLQWQKNKARRDSQTYGMESHRPEESSSRSSYEETGYSSPNKSTPFQNIPMSARGVVLVSLRELPDNYRSVFHFPVFNAVQSKCFQPVYKTDDNIVLAAPTGSGKTVVMELAICRLLNNLQNERFKVVYQAPTKSLCSERFRDWNRKFRALGLQCAELTGDTDYTQMRSVQNSQIIITTPEKWDSMTRKWKDHTRLMQMVKLFLIDEVHILKEARGATLEAVVSRMKAIGSNVRFVALSATIPNSEDIATWLGKNTTNQHVPAHREHFGEEFRPVKLQKFVYGYQSHGNDFAFDKMCSSKLPDVIATHSCKKPVMIFCCTRNSSVSTAKELVRLWSMSNPPARLWKGPNKHMEVHNIDLKATIIAGVAFHHAGLDPNDRHTVETGFLQGQISIICCTSTLAIGVNLPCHLVIIKNTVGWQDGGCREYSDLEIIQMLGRAGRPQFDDTSTAVILTRKERVGYYEKLVSGTESLESCLHLNLIDHLNAEIGLGNVTDIESAIRWLASTFLFVRLRRNPTYYHLKEGANKNDEDEMLRQICEKDIRSLRECGLIATEQLRSTQFGDAMARYYVRFETMKTFLTLKKQASTSEVLSVVAQAEEFREIRLKAGEKSLYREINRAGGIWFPIKVDLALPAHKISLLIQSELGAVDFPDSEQFQKHKFSFQQDKSFVFSHINRLIRCIIDCQITLADSVAVKNALDLARSFGAKVWDGSPLQIKQIDQVGVVTVRKLTAAGITSLEALEQTEPHRIDMILSKNPPFGMKLLGRLADFPKLRVSVKKTGRDINPGAPVKVRFKADVAFMNEKCPISFQRRPVYVCFLAETSDGRLIDFRRISASKLQSNHEITLTAEIKGPDQLIRCHVMCDDIAGTLRSAEIQADLPPSLFPGRSSSGKTVVCQNQPTQMNISRQRSNNSSQSRMDISRKADTFDYDDFIFDDLLEMDILTNTPPPDIEVPKAHPNEKPTGDISGHDESEPTRLDNGKWACNHRCKDKKLCKHFCCRDGLDKPPKASKKQSGAVSQKTDKFSQMTLSASVAKKKAPMTSSHGQQHTTNGSESLTTEQEQCPSLITFDPSSVSSDFGPGNDTSNPSVLNGDYSSDYGDDSLDDLPSPSALLLGMVVRTTSPDNGKSIRVSNAEEDMFIGDDWLFTDEPLHLTQAAPLAKSPQRSRGDGQRSVGGDKIEGSTKEALQKDALEPRNNIRDKNAQEHSDTAVLARALSLDDSGGTKRKLAATDPNQQSKDREGRPKRNKTETSTHNSSPHHQEDDDNATEQSNGGHPDRQYMDISGPSAMPADWEGIDPTLLNEFKDIIDFF